MNWLKPYFLLIVTGYWLLLSILTAFYFYSTGINFSTLGMALSAFVPWGFLISLTLRKKANTSPNQVLLTFIILAGVLLIAFGEPKLSLTHALLYCVSLTLWLLYLLWYSPLPVKYSEILVPGKTLPDLQFSTYDNKAFYCSSLLGKKVVYLFYRGSWCPVCMTQLKGIADQYLSLKERDAEVLLISPQSQAKSKELADKFGIDLHFLTDQNNKMAKLLGIEDKNGTPIDSVLAGNDRDTVLPTVIITDELGKIIYLDRTDNYRIRPEAKSLIDAIS